MKIKLKRQSAIFIIAMMILNIFSVFMPKNQASAMNTKDWGAIQGKLDTYVGQPYSWGDSPGTCTGAVRYALRNAYGFTNYPAYVQQYNKDILNAEGTKIVSGASGKDVSAWNRLKPGDVFIAYNSSGDPSHIGVIYSGTNYDNFVLWHSIENFKYHGVIKQTLKEYLSANADPKYAHTFDAWRVVDDAKGYVKLKKGIASNSNLTKLCPEQYSLAGAEYGVYKTYSDAMSGSNLIGKLITDANGDTNSLQVKIGQYFVKEIKAPLGYSLDAEIKRVNVEQNKTAMVSSSDIPQFDPLSLTLKKKAEDGADKNLSLEGAEYTVKYYKELLTEEQVKSAVPFRTWVFRADKNGDIKLREAWKVGGDELFKEDDGSVVGLYGTYTFEETKAPKGFARTEGLVSLQHVTKDERADKIVVLKDVTDIEKEQKVAIKINKKDSETGENKAQGYGSLAGAIYEVFHFDPNEAKDVKVGEIVTDEKGEGILGNLKAGLYSVIEKTASNGYIVDTEKKTVHARLQGLNTAVFTYEVTSLEKPINVKVLKTTVDETGAIVPLVGAKLQLVNSEGKMLEEWISTKEAKTFKALPKGIYTIKEIEPPKGYLPLDEDYTFEVKETGDIQGFDVLNEPVPEIKTEAFFKGGVKSALNEKDQQLIDRVNYNKLLKGHSYTYEGKVVLKDNPEIVVAEGRKTFTPENSKGSVDLEFKVDASNLAGKELVAIGKLYRDDRKGDKLVATHEDLNDKDQTVTIPKIRTTATDKVDGTHDALAGEKTVIVDKVDYEKLIVGKEYTVTGKLMNKETGEAILIDGKEVTSSKKFKAETPNGKVEITFEIDARALKGERVVVFEDVYEKGIKVGTHADITDEEQSITFPKIGTTATSQEDNSKSVLPLKEVTVKDKVDYEKLNNGDKYIVKGSLIHKATKKVIKTQEKEFTSQETGSEMMSFTFDARELRGSDTVVFEEVYKVGKDGKLGKLVAEHKDINDEGQTVRVENPTAKTTATVNGEKTVKPQKNIEIVDTVEYSNLIEDRKYRIKGILIDKSTGKPFVQNGKEIRSEAEFIANGKNGNINMSFNIDGSKLNNKEFVVFEYIYYDDQLITEHTDITDKGQTVKIEENPKTGDISFISILLNMIICFAGMYALLVVKRKRGIYNL